MICIVNLGMGNLGSIQNMLKKIGAPSVISGQPDDIEKAEKLILPGVGSFDTGMQNIDRSGLLPVLQQKVLSQCTPILGICLGMQLFTNSSEEGVKCGLGWVAGKTVRFNVNAEYPGLKIPHMGWNSVEPAKDDVLFRDLDDEARFYFVHSYHVQCPEEYVIGKTFYGTDFISALRKNNIWGVQFHPEKSHRYGMALLRNFVNQG